MTLEKNTNTDGETSRSSEESSSKEPQPEPQSPDAIQKSSTVDEFEQNADETVTETETETVTETETETKTEQTAINVNKSTDKNTDYIQSDWNTEADNEEMKRTNAKKLIERYFYQLSDGCGNPNCSNRNCASSGAIRHLTPNQAAARAIQLFSEEAQLCEVRNSRKIARSMSPEHESFSSCGIGGIAIENAPRIGVNDARYPRTLSMSESPTSQTPVKSIYTGAIQNADTTNESINTSQPPPSSLENLPYLDETNLNELIDYCKKTDRYALLIRNLGRIFSSRDHLIKSFQRQPSTHIDDILQKAPRDLKTLKKEDFRAMEDDLDKDDDCSCADDDSSLDDQPITRSHTSVDLISLRRAMGRLFSISNSIFDSLNNALQTLAIGLGLDLRVLSKTNQIEDIITAFVIVFEIIMISKIDFVEVALPSICQAASHLPLWAQARLVWIWGNHSRDGMKKLLESLQQLISLQVIAGNYTETVHVQDNETIKAVTKVMKLVYYTSIVCGQLESPKFREEDADADSESAQYDDDTFASYIPRRSRGSDSDDGLANELNVSAQDCRKPFIPFEEFYNHPLSDAIEMDQDYLNYKNSTEKNFSFMLYSFILTPATKIQGLYYDCRIRMYTERRLHIFHAQLGQSAEPYLRLKVRRDHLIDDALVELEMIAMGNPKDLKKQLVVEFANEQGIDEGGVSKEFFHLVVEQIFNPDYGMFVFNDDTRTMWFNSTSFENEAQFSLIGIVLGLAIYNNIILAVNFPMVVYRKLMGIKGSFRDLQDWNPTIYKSLLDMLNYQNNDMEEVFMQTFRINYQDVFGNLLTHDLKSDSENLYVNQDNKQEFVDLYADYLLNKSVERKFRAFRRGFQMVTDESPLHLLFRAEEIELLVCGSEDFDFNELEKATEYEGGFNKNSQTIVDFWDIVHALSTEVKRKLLEFTTGSDRVPVGGLSRLKLVIVRNGSDTDRLPTSHTCYNVLLLPEYSTKEKLEERLLKAINYSKGFGMI